MITVSQLISRIGSLLGVSTPEAGDSIITIPNTYLGPLPFPTLLPVNFGNIFNDSYIQSFGNTITNTGGGSSNTMATVVPGVWEFSFIIDSEFNWLDANPIAQDNRLIFQTTAGNLEVWSMAARVTRTVIVIPPFRLTVKDPLQVRMLQNGNGAGQTSTLQINTIATRLL